MSDLQAITDTLITGDSDKLQELVRGALAAGTPANQILQKGLIAGNDQFCMNYIRGVRADKIVA